MRAASVGLVGVCALGLLLPGQPRAAASLDGRAVMEQVDQRPRGADEMVRARWRLIDSQGGERVREIRAYWKDERGAGEGNHSKRIIVFDAPASIRDMSFLVYSHGDPGKEDLRWVYLPALRKVRRIAGRERDKRFAGSDFTYDDLSDRALDEDDHVLLRTEERDGRTHHVVESHPRGPSAYARRVQWVDAENHVVTRAEFFDRADRLERTLEATWQNVDGIWFWDRLEMQNPGRKHATVIEVEETRHDLDLGASFFHQNTLRRGVR